MKKNLLIIMRYIHILFELRCKVSDIFENRVLTLFHFLLNAI